MYQRYELLFIFRFSSTNDAKASGLAGAKTKRRRVTRVHTHHMSKNDGVCACMYAYVCPCMHAYMYVCACVRDCLCVCECVCVCVKSCAFTRISPCWCSHEPGYGRAREVTMSCERFCMHVFVLVSVTLRLY